MGHQNKEVDEESLQARERVRSRRLDTFLIVSVLVLFLAVTALAVGGYVVVSARGSRPSPAEASGGSPLQLSADPPSPAFRMHNFAYVELLSSVVENKTVPWGLVNYGTGTSIGNNFDFNQEHHSLMPRQFGAYFLYIEVNLTCTDSCSDGLLRLQVGDELHCDVYLKGDKRSVSKKCWTVAQLGRRGLVTQMRVDLPKTDWKLEKKGSGLGMFFIG